MGLRSLKSLLLTGCKKASTDFILWLWTQTSCATPSVSPKDEEVFQMEFFPVSLFKLIIL